MDRRIQFGNVATCPAIAALLVTEYRLCLGNIVDAVMGSGHEQNHGWVLCRAAFLLTVFKSVSATKITASSWGQKMEM